MDYKTAFVVNAIYCVNQNRTLYLTLINQTSVGDISLLLIKLLITLLVFGYCSDPPSIHVYSLFAILQFSKKKKKRMESLMWLH